MWFRKTPIVNGVAGKAVENIVTDKVIIDYSKPNAPVITPVDFSGTGTVLDSTDGLAGLMARLQKKHPR